MRNKNIIGTNIKYFRKLNHLDIEELAKMLNIANSTLYNWERGDRLPDINNLIKLSEIFKISLDDLVGEQGLHKFQSEIIEYNNNKIKNHFGNNDIFILFKEIDVLTDEELEQIDWAIQRAKLKRKK